LNHPTAPGGLGELSAIKMSHPTAHLSLGRLKTSTDAISDWPHFILQILPDGIITVDGQMDITES
jgi:hypothetical protein